MSGDPSQRTGSEHKEWNIKIETHQNVKGNKENSNLLGLAEIVHLVHFLGKGIV